MLRKFDTMLERGIELQNIFRLLQFAATEPPVAFFPVGQSETAHHLLEELFHSKDPAAFSPVGEEPPSSLHVLHEDGCLVENDHSRSRQHSTARSLLEFLDEGWVPEKPQGAKVRAYPRTFASDAGDRKDRRLPSFLPPDSEAQERRCAAHF